MRITPGWFLGLVSLAAVVILWVLSSFLVNEIFETELYAKPFFITYINTSIFIFYLIPLLLKIARKKLSGEPFSLRDMIRQETEPEQISRRLSQRSDELPNAFKNRPFVDLESQVETTELIPNNNDSASDHSSITRHEPLQKHTQERMLSLGETIKLSFQFCIMWYLANLVTNASLQYTSVSSQTILSSTLSFFTLFFGYFFKMDSINRVKIASLVLSLGGIILITKIDSESDPSKLSLKDDNYGLAVFVGNFLALLGACFYGAYTVLLKLKVKSQERLNAKLFFGFVGIFNLILLWPTLILWDYTGVEKFELPSTGFVWRVILLNCVITFVSDYCWAIAVLLTSPLTVTVGLSLTIPLALLGDCLFKGRSITIGYLVAAGLIAVSFLMINKEQEGEEEGNTA